MSTRDFRDGGPAAAQDRQAAPLPAGEADQPGRPGPLRRSTSDSVVGGVCGGLGASLGVDPLWFRLAFVVLALGNGAGILLYLVAWIIVPRETADLPTPHREHHRPGRGSIIAGLTLVAVGAALLLDTLLPWFDDILWPLAVIIAGLGLVYVGSQR